MKRRIFPAIYGLVQFALSLLFFLDVVNFNVIVSIILAFLYGLANVWGANQISGSPRYYDHS